MKKYQKIFDKVKKEEEPKMMKNEKSSNITNPPRTYLHKNEKQVETVILAGMQFQGDVKGSHNLFLNGEFNGTIDLDALLFVGQSGKMVGEVKAERVIIEGTIEGTITANEKIELREGGKCKGDIFTPSVMISDKAFFQGQVTMIDEKDDSREVKKTYKENSESKNESPEITVVDEKDTSETEVKQRRRKILVHDEN